MTGFINVNKECGVSSAREVGVIKKLTGVPCGHMGTLDPMASGVLPVAIGKAARLFDYFLDKHKTYVAVFEFGKDSDTLDTTGNMTVMCGRVPDKSEILAVLPTFIGKIMQIPPNYSAKNVNGKRGYQLAREGKEFTLPPKEVEIFSIRLIDRVDENSYSFEIECGGGTYIRSIARDISKSLGTCAVMSRLERTASGIFKIQDAVKSQRLNTENIASFIIPTESVLPFESVHPDGSDAKRLFNGLSVKCGLKDGTYKLYGENGFYGLATAKNGFLNKGVKLC